MAQRERPTRREAIVDAMIQVAGSKGYLALSVADVIAEARTSRTTFYKHFDDKQDCFLAAFDLAATRIVTTAEAGCGAGGDWPERARGGLAAAVELLGAEPRLARVAVVEAAVAGAQARRRQLAAIGRLAGLLEPGREHGRGDGPPASTSLMAVGGVVGLLFDELREGRSASRPDLLPELEFALLVPFLGVRGARSYAAPGAPVSV